MRELDYYVYRHTSPSGKIYIGITSRKPELRWNNGHGYKNNIYFCNAIEKYGWDSFIHEILIGGISKSEAESKERELISLYDSSNPNSGYNIALGGNTRGKCAESTKCKIGELARRRIEDGRVLPPMLGRTHSLETKKHWSDTRKGVSLSVESVRKREATIKANGSKNGENNGYAKSVICVETEKRYGTMSEASKDTGADRSSIGVCCKTNSHTAGGYHWRYSIKAV